MAPRMYLALDANFTSSASIEALGETFGPGGPLTIVALLGMAKQQGARGEVKTTRRKLASDAFLSSPDDAHKIVLAAIELGILAGLDLTDRTIHVRLVRWGEWQPRMSAAERQAEARRKAALNGSAPEEVSA
jgi:hypothetical protein